LQLANHGVVRLLEVFFVDTIIILNQFFVTVSDRIKRFIIQDTVQ
jgi:hypothetical protein